VAPAQRRVGGTRWHRDPGDPALRPPRDLSARRSVSAFGDRATRVALEAIEEAKRQSDGQLRLRLTLSHLEVVDQPDLSRFEQLGVVANFTPHWFGNYLQGAAPGLGKRRWYNREPARTLLEHGARLTFSSDVTGYAEMHRADPFYGMPVAHNRQDIGAEDGPIRPPAEERLSVDTLLHGYTANGAYQRRMDAVVGSIEAGKHADLVVLDRNPFETDRSAIHKIRPTAVIRGAELTFCEL
jgi:predicted amidohydrolase YtcJ